MKEKLVTLNEISISPFKLSENENYIIKDLSLKIYKSEFLGVIGKTGSGKTTLGKLFNNMLPVDVVLKKGTIAYEIEKEENVNQKLKGDIVSMVFQDPMTSLNPLQTIKDQFILILNKRFNYENDQVIIETKKWLNKVRVSNALEKYPHQLSGGQLQRVMIALAIAIKPKLIIADEITTALDANLKYEIMNLLNVLRLDSRITLLFITHDLVLAKQFCDRIAILRGGKLIEINYAPNIFRKPQEVYTKKLISQLNASNIKRRKRKKKDIILNVDKINKTYKTQRVLKGVSISLFENTTLGVIGESGSGKTTLAKIILNITSIDSGTIKFHKWENKISAVFQDSFSSFNPRMNIKDILLEPLNILKATNKRSKVYSILKRVRLESDILKRFAHEISGGQRQRVSIARALLIKPKILVLDEPTSSLDIDVQDSIINLLLQLQQEEKLCYFFISHDLNVIKRVSDYIAVLYNGKIIEKGAPDEIFKSPKESYTRQLINSTYDINI